MTAILNNVNAEIDNIDNMSQLIIGNKDVHNYLQKNINQDLRVSQNAIRSLYDITNIFNHISSVYLFSNEGNYVNASNGITYLDVDVANDAQWLSEIDARAGGYVIRINGDGAFARPDNENVISFIRIINSIETQKPIGMLAINLSTKLLDNTYKNMSDVNRSFSFYTENHVVLSKEEGIDRTENIPFEEELYKQRITEQENILSYYRIKETPFVLTSFERIRIEEGITKESGKIMIIMLIVTIGAITLIGIFITQYITNPIEKLAMSMKTVKLGWLRRLSIKLADDEIGYQIGRAHV